MARKAKKSKRQIKYRDILEVVKEADPTYEPYYRPWQNAETVEEFQRISDEELEAARKHYAGANFATKFDRGIPQGTQIIYFDKKTIPIPGADRVLTRKTYNLLQNEMMRRENERELAKRKKRGKAVRRNVTERQEKNLERRKATIEAEFAERRIMMESGRRDMDLGVMDRVKEIKEVKTRVERAKKYKPKKKPKPKKAASKPSGPTPGEVKRQRQRERQAEKDIYWRERIKQTEDLADKAARELGIDLSIDIKSRPRAEQTEITRKIIRYAYNNAGEEEPIQNALAFKLGISKGAVGSNLKWLREENLVVQRKPKQRRSGRWKFGR